MKNCKQCGAANEENAKWCQSCGANLSENEFATAESPKPTGEQAEAQTPPTEQTPPYGAQQGTTPPPYGAAQNTPPYGAQTPPPYGTTPPPYGNYQNGYQQPGQQPNYYPAGTVPNHLVKAIVSIFFCTILGIIAIVYASQVNTKLAAGDLAGAQQSAKTANTCANIGLAVGIVVCVIYFILGIMMGLGAASGGY